MRTTPPPATDSTSDPSGDITQLLNRWAGGDSSAQDQLFSLVYPRLQSLASSFLRREPHAVSLQTTELVNEAYLKLVNQRPRRWQQRSQFFAFSATVIRRILVDQAKQRKRLKRGKGQIHLTLEEEALPGIQRDVDLLALDLALVELAGVRLSAARIVELKFFAGLSLEETAETLGLGRTTVQRRWRFARSWLARKLR
ncbi:MAG: sigma-70 family RNA polymerase sigma factor [Deltaproteobacteria bacterium]|nr:sigma-70 family RNA polymerase sigma factor [Deltaproteobacteria bacterium]